MSTANANQTSLGFSEQPIPLRRSADWLVLLILIAALALGWRLREQVINAADSVNVADAGVSMLVPKRSIALPGARDLWAVETPSGMRIRINEMPIPTLKEGQADPRNNPLVLVTDRALEEARTVDMFRSVSTAVQNVAGVASGIQEYLYVDQNASKFYSSPLRIMHGYEALVPQGDRVIIISLEGPDTNWDQVKEYWPRLLNSLKFSEVKK